MGECFILEQSFSLVVLTHRCPHRFMSKRKLVTREHINMAAHQTAVELSLMYELKKPLAYMCAITEQEEEVIECILQCSISVPADANSTGSLEGWLAFPNQRGKDLLHSVFKQIGRDAVVAEAASLEEPVQEGPHYPTSVGSSVAEAEPAEQNVAASGVYDMGCLSVPLIDPEVKFAVCPASCLLFP